MELVYAIVMLGGLGAVFGLLLAWVAQVFAIEVDERVESIEEILPGANCGACGCAGCSNFAEKVVAGESELTACIPGGKDVADQIAEILCLECKEAVPHVAVVRCAGNHQHAQDKFIYGGAMDCRLAESMWDGFKSCRYGCLGMGTCVQACSFGAITMGEDGLPVIDENKCLGCGLCQNACPRGIISIIPKDYSGGLVLCNSRDRGKKVKEACAVGCIACRACVKACPNEAISFEDNLPVIDPEKCTDCGECVLKCKPGSIQIREVEK
ncbi:MAG: RnfABCDGE type electron transport complex subunit B [Dethiobacteria bacterium]